MVSTGPAGCGLDRAEKDIRLEEQKVICESIGDSGEIVEIRS